MIRNAYIESLGFRLAFTEDLALVRPLLEACGLSPVDPQSDPPDTYLMATTAAGGIAACVGWTRFEESAVIHSLAVAPSTRGTGLGASLTATTFGYIMDRGALRSLYLATGAARRFFARFGFAELDPEDIPPEVAAHPAFEAEGLAHMGRHYNLPSRGLDQCVFRIVENPGADAVMPQGSLLFVTQSGGRLEAGYRGGPVESGHLLGRIIQDEIEYLWHAFSAEGELLDGRGLLAITSLEDGRRELREASTTEGLVMREV